MGRRLALLIATYQYRDEGLGQLTAPAHDAEALAAVLRNPDIAGFEVTMLINEPHHRVGEAIGDLYRDRRRDDLTLLYFTGHGLKDDDGRLYLAMTNTRRDSLLFTSLSAEQIDYAMTGCASRQQVLILDCCYSGAFPAGRIAKADTEVHALERFQGRGRTVLTASDATQYSFEGDQPRGEAAQSVFTRHLVAGLRDGSADLDGDGDITLDELYSYIHDRVVEEMPRQRPKKQDNVQGRTIIARNVNWSLPAHLRHALSSPIAVDRQNALDGLNHLYRIGNDLVRARVLNEIQRLAEDEGAQVPPPLELPAGPLDSVATDTHKSRAWPRPTRRRIALAAVIATILLAAVGSVLIFNRGAGTPPPSNPPGSVLSGLAVSPDGRRVYVANSLGKVSVIDTTTNAIVGNPIALGHAAEGVAVSPDGRRLYVTADGVRVIDTATNTTVGKPIRVGSYPYGVAVSPDGRRVYITNHYSDSVDIIDTATNRRVGEAITGGINLPYSVAVSPDSRRVYVTNHDNVSVIDTATNTTIGSPIPVGDIPMDLAVSPDGHHVYVTNYVSNDMSVIDTTTNTTVGSPIRVEETPYRLAVTPDGHHLYLTNQSTDNVSVIDTTTNTTVGDPIPVGDNPYDVAVSPDSRRVYITNQRSNNVSVIDTATNTTIGEPITIPG